jgi:hypothetical protein
MPSICLQYGLGVALGGFGVARADSFSILRILTPVSHPQSVEARLGHGQYPEDAKPKCSFLTACLPCLLSQMRKPPPKLPSDQTWRRGWLKTDTGGPPIRYRSNTGVTRLQVACRVLWPRESQDSRDCGLSGKRREGKAEGSRQKAEINRKRVEVTRPSRERRCSE